MREVGYYVVLRKERKLCIVRDRQRESSKPAMEVNQKRGHAL